MFWTDSVTYNSVHVYILLWESPFSGLLDFFQGRKENLLSHSHFGFVIIDFSDNSSQFN
jgi:hypothetical protein